MPRRTAGRASQTAAGGPSRRPAGLSRETVVSAAVALADRDGLGRLSMRRLGQELGVDPMALCHHVRDRETLVAAMLDSVVAGIADDPAPDAGPWPDRLRTLVMAARRTMLRHPWAARAVADSDTPTPAVLAYLERVLAVLRGGGCSVGLTHHALHLLGSRVLGFSQDLFDDSPGTRPDPATAAAMAQAWAQSHPHVAELATAVTHDGGLGGCDDDTEFDFALDVLLEGLERRRRAEARHRPREASTDRGQRTATRSPTRTTPGDTTSA